MPTRRARQAWAYNGKASAISSLINIASGCLAPVRGWLPKHFRWYFGRLTEASMVLPSNLRLRYRALFLYVWVESFMQYSGSSRLS